MLANSLYDKTRANELYIQSIPRDIRDGVFDNEYVNNLQLQLEFALKIFLPDSLLDDLYTLLYEGSFEVIYNETDYLINDKVSFFNYVTEVYFDENGEYKDAK